MTWGWGPRPDGVIGDYSTSLTDVNFNWQGRGSEDVKQGGAKGTPAESKVAHAWPTYEAEYLQKRLREGRGKYAHRFTAHAMRISRMSTLTKWLMTTKRRRTRHFTLSFWLGCRGGTKTM